MEYQHIQQFGKKIRDNVNKVMIGRDHTCLVMLSALLSGGHVLLEDMPGTGKTVLAKSLAKSMALSFARIQFTPDLLPSDVTGISVYQPRTCWRTRSTAQRPAPRARCWSAWRKSR